MNKQKGYTPAVYMHLLQHFAETGECEAPELHREDAIASYLTQTMSDVTLRAQVLGSPVCARIFMDTMVQFVSLMLQKANYHLQRVSAEQKTNRSRLLLEPDEPARRLAGTGAASGREV